MKFKKISRILASASTVAIAALLLTSCASSTSSTSSDREAQGLGTRLCVINNTSMNMQIKWRGYPDARSIPPAGQNCNSGYERLIMDIAATLQYEPVAYPGGWLSWEIEGNNDPIGEAILNVWYTAQNEKYGMPIEGTVGKTAAMQTDWVRGDLVRVADSESHVEWVLTLTNASGDNFATRFKDNVLIEYGT